MTPWPDIPTVLAIHSLSLRRFGGVDGVRDMRLLESALTQPLATFHGVDLYPSGIMKAARLAYGIIRNHPFHDGNKRTGAALLGALILADGKELITENLELSDVVLTLASGEWEWEQWWQWVNEHTR